MRFTPITLCAAVSFILFIAFLSSLEIALAAPGLIAVSAQQVLAPPLNSRDGSLQAIDHDSSSCYRPNPLGLKERFGFIFDRSAGQPMAAYEYGQLNAGWYHDYGTQLTSPNGIQYHQMIRPSINGETLTDTIAPIVDANPGVVWYVGNEPDKENQDNLTPAQYAEFYYDVYSFLKARDPSAQVATAGIVQATPLRLAYLDRLLDEYEKRYGQKMPVDAMTIHGYILCEVCSWGAGTPPGMGDSDVEGQAYSVEDHIDIDIFKAQVIAMRQWMADRGYRNKPLVINDYGILMPRSVDGIWDGDDFGYEAVSEYMLATFDFLLTATDEEIGYPNDENRLVQQFAWFSLNAEPYNPNTYLGFNGELFVHDTLEMTQLGQDYTQFTGEYLSEHTFPKVSNQHITIPEDTPLEFILAGTDLVSQPITITLSNGGPFNGQLGGLSDSGQLSTTVVYSPNHNFVGDDCIQFYVNDARGLLVRGAVRITIEAVNDAPTASQKLAYAANEDEPLVVPSYAGLESGGTFDPDAGDRLNFSASDNSMRGASVEAEPNGAFSYDPSAVPELQAIPIGQIVSDTFAYSVTDSSNASDTALVTMWIEGRNDPPIANADVFTMAGNSSLEIIGLLLENDVDIDRGDVLRLDSIPVQVPSSGTVMLLTNGTAIYSPNPAFIGTDTFQYSVCDRGVPIFCSEGIVTIIVTDPCQTSSEGDGCLTPEPPSETLPLLPPTPSPKDPKDSETANWLYLPFVVD